MGLLRRLAGAPLALVLAGCGATDSASPVTVTATTTVTVPARPMTPTVTTVPTGGQVGSLHRFGEEVSTEGGTIRVSAPTRGRLAAWKGCPGSGIAVVVTFHNTGALPWPRDLTTSFTGMWDGVMACDGSDLTDDLGPIEPGHTRTLTRRYSLGRTAAPFTLEIDLGGVGGPLYWTNDAAALSAVGK